MLASSSFRSPTADSPYAGTYALEGLSGRPPSVVMATVGGDSNAVFDNAPLPTLSRLRGGVQLHLTVTPPRSQGTLIANLYDVDGTGQGTAYDIQRMPYTWVGATPGKRTDIDVTIAPHMTIPLG